MPRNTTRILSPKVYKATLQVPAFALTSLYLYMAAPTGTILMLFSRSVQAEACRKQQLHPAGHIRRALSQAFIHHSRQLAQQSGLPWVQIDESQQEGDSFGERFHNAFRQLFAAGYSRVIAIGNDSPDLEPAHIQRAATLLDTQELVLGPASDGGFYLMGFRRKAFEALPLSSLPWQSSSLAAALYTTLLQSGLDFHCLPAILQDIDDAMALRQYLRSGQNKAMLAVLYCIVQESTAIRPNAASLRSQDHFYTTGLRAPPRA